MLGVMQVVLVLAFPAGQDKAAHDAGKRLAAEWCAPNAELPLIDGAVVAIIDGPSDADDIGRAILARAIAERGPDA